MLNPDLFISPHKTHTDRQNIFVIKSWWERVLRNSQSSCQYFYNITKLYITDKHIYKHAAAATAAKLLQSCPTLCDPIDGSPLGFSVPGIFQARTLEWVAISFSNAWKWKVKVKSLSGAPSLSDPMDCSPPGSSIHRVFQARVLEWVAIATCLLIVGFWEASSQTQVW